MNKRNLVNYGKLITLRKLHFLPSAMKRFYIIDIIHLSNSTMAKKLEKQIQATEVRVSLSHFRMY